MTNRFIRIILGVNLLFVLVPASASALALPSVSKALPPAQILATSTAPAGCDKSFLGLEPWFFFLTNNLNDGSVSENPGLTAKDAAARKCDIRCFNVTPRDAADPNDCGQTKSDIPLVLLAVIDDLLRIAGLVAVGFVVYGAYQYVLSEGNPDATSRAQGTIINALIGMALAMSAVLIVSYLGHALGS